MFRLVATLAALSLACPALADSDKNGKPGKAPPGLVADCPPGLAKKNPPCIPPGQVGKSWHPGDRLLGDYLLIPRGDWDRLDLLDHRDGSGYVIIDNQILRVLLGTLIVLEVIRVLDQLTD